MILSPIPLVAIIIYVRQQGVIATAGFAATALYTGHLVDVAGKQHPANGR